MLWVQAASAAAIIVVILILLVFSLKFLGPR